MNERRAATRPTTESEMTAGGFITHLLGADVRVRPVAGVVGNAALPDEAAVHRGGNVAPSLPPPPRPC
jgi:hypothetical protein